MKHHARFRLGSAVPFALAGALLGGTVGVGVAFGADRPTDTICAACHEDVASDLEWTSHGSDAFIQGPGVTAADHCQVCHGDGTAHAEEADPGLIERPQGAEQHRLCLTCHDQQLDAPTLGASAHAGNGVFCTSCHDVHPKKPAEATPQLALLKVAPGALCADCHVAQAASFKKPYSHRLDRGGMGCDSCHDPHGGTGQRSLVVDRLGDGPCESCHSEKRGPFVFTHASNGIAGDCLTCHESHGSNNPKRLRRHRLEQLCLECHTTFPGGNLGGQPPSFHDLRSVRFRNCTTCHVAIHGSNTSPALLK